MTFSSNLTETGVLNLHQNSQDMSVLQSQKETRHFKTIHTLRQTILVKLSRYVNDTYIVTRCVASTTESKHRFLVVYRYCTVKAYATYFFPSARPTTDCRCARPTRIFHTCITTQQEMVRECAAWAWPYIAMYVCMDVYVFSTQCQNWGTYFFLFDRDCFLV